MKRTLSLIFLLFFSSCHFDNYPSSKDSCQNIDASLNKNTFSVTDLITSIDFIPLQEEKGILVTNIKQLYVNESLFIIHNYYSSEIKFFNKDGKYLHKSKSIGSGALGYSSLCNIFYNKGSGIVYFTDMVNNKILKYDIGLHKIVDEIYCEDYSPYAIGSLDENICVISNDRANGFLKLFNGNDLVWSGVTEPQFTNTVLTNHPMCYDQNQLFINPGFNDTIYSIKNNELMPAFSVEKGISSLHSLNFEEYILNYIQGKEMNESLLLIPFGQISAYQGIFFIELTARDKILIWNNNIKAGTVLQKNKIQNWELVFYPTLFEIFDFDKNGNAYSQVIPSKSFRNSLAAFLSNNQSGPYIENFRKINSFLKNHENFENPIIVKFSLSLNNSI